MRLKLRKNWPSLLLAWPGFTSGYRAIRIGGDVDFALDYTKPVFDFLVNWNESIIPVIGMVWLAKIHRPQWFKKIGSFLTGTNAEESPKRQVPTERINELESRLIGVTTELDQHKKETRQKKADLKELDAKFKLAMNRVTVVEAQRDEYKGAVEDKEKKLSDCRGKHEALRKDYGGAILWVQGRNWKSRGLSVAVQHVRVEDAELAKRIRGLLADRLQGDSHSRENHKVEHILIPFDNPSGTARVVLFSDSEVGTEVTDAFNRHKLISEKMARVERSFAGDKVPDVDIAIVVFPND